MGKQAIQRIDSDFEDDFESDLVLPEGPLSLRLSSKSKGAAAATSASRARSMHGQQQQRPHTSHSDTSSISGSSSIIFSTSSSESNATASESEDQMCDISARLLQHARTTATTVNSRGGHALDNGQQDTSEEDEDDDDERSNTLKANQLPTDFAEQLALSKAQAALAKGSNPTPTDATSNSHAGTHSSTDWEADIVFNLSSSLNTSRILSKKASFTSHISDSGSVHSRSSTSHSQASASSSINKTSASSRSGQVKSDDEEGFFEDLELPSYFGSRHKAHTSDITPPSSVESKASSSRKGDLQSLLNQKLKARVGLRDTFAIQAAQTASTPPVVRPEPRKKTLSPKYVDKHDERFEDSFIFDDTPPQAVNTRPAAARPSLTSSSSSRSLMNIPSSRSIERIAPLPSSSYTLSSRSSSTRSSTTIRPSRSSLNLKEGATKTASTADSASLNSKNITSWGRTAASTTASSLRSRPSLSNLSGIAASPISAATPRPSTLQRKQSHNTLNESIRTHGTMSSERPSSSMAHYAQPTRASLARHHHQHLPFATISRSDSFSRPSTPLASVFQQQESRIALASSPSSTANSVGGVFSRLTRPTIASSAKSHKVTGSDPSGRTSASLGMPITSSNPSSPLKSMKVISTSRDGMNQHAAITRALYKQPRRTQTLGDGSELDGIDDLPVNREKEKKFVKIPIRRRQSSGMASVDSIRSNITTATMIGNARGVPVSQQMSTSRRDRVDSAPEQEQMQTFNNKKPSANAITSTKPLNKVSSLLLADDGKAGKTTKRPGLKLIRNLSASGLSRIQGQMKWNPVLLKWEGNESSLRDFDNVIASSARPALISPLGPLSPRNVYSTSPLANLPGSDDQQANTNSIEQKILSISNPHGTTPSLGGVRIVGDMIFDPVKRSWFSTSSEGEEEINFGDDEEEDDGDNQNKTHRIDAWEGGEQARLKTRRSFAKDWSSNASSTGDDQQESNWSFADFSRKQRDADKRHKEEMNAWREAEATQIQTMPDIRKYLK